MSTKLTTDYKELQGASNDFEISDNPKTTLKGLILVLLIFGTITSLRAEDLRKIVQLTGTWKFSIGDDPAWAQTSFNDIGWDNINVPNRWEAEGYDDYNGYAWYRKKFSMPEVNSKEPLYLMLGKIDDADEVYLNGKRIGKSGQFPPTFATAYNQERRYRITTADLNLNGTNTIAIKVFDFYREGGIISDPVGIYVDEDNRYLNFMFSENWKFHPGDNKQWANSNYDDASWQTIKVPSVWEDQGYTDYDGYAWYRKTFKMPESLNSKELYLSLGKIDDYDYVYVNGKLIGSVFDLKKDNDYRRKGYEYNARRVYKIPSEILNKNGINTIAIRVYDMGLGGGIYVGPVGLMDKENYKEYSKRHYSNQTIVDYLLDEFFME
jgi:hypothetical protein